MNENEKGFGQGKQEQQGDITGQDKNQQFGQGQQAETGQGQQFGQDQQLGQDQQAETGQGQQTETDQKQPGGDGSAFFGEGKPGEQGQQDQSAWPEKGQREDQETGAGSESPDKSGGRY